MELIVGNEYYWLSAEEYAQLSEILQQQPFEGNEFVLGPDGYYYAEMDSIDEDTDEWDYLMDAEVLHSTYYSTSTQPGGSL